MTYLERKHKIAHDWFERGRKGKDPFDRFISLWIAFNALYCVDEIHEYLQIDNFIKHNYSYKYNEVLTDIDFFHKTISNLHPVGSAPLSTKEYADTLKSDKATNKEKLQKLFQYIYIARCNLFHGEKTPGRYHDEEIASHSADILEKYLTIYFGEKCELSK